MPSNELWVQYSLIGILVLAAGIIAVGFYRLWKDLLDWFEIQDKKRIAERDTQRAWQSEQDRIRDERWQNFLTSIQNGWLRQDQDHIEVQRELVGKVDDLISLMNNHDTWARARGKE